MTPTKGARAHHFPADDAGSPARARTSAGRSLRSFLLPAAALLILIESFSLIAPIIFSLLLILLISLAVNPVVARIRALTGRRAAAATLVAVGFIVVLILTGWAFFRPMKSSADKLSTRLPSYWERVQKPLIKLEKQAGLAEEKLQAEVATEVLQTKVAPGANGAGTSAPASPAPPVPRKPAAVTEPAAAAQPNFIRSQVGQVLGATFGRFTALAFNAAQILVVLVTVFFGVTFTLMNPRPVFGTIFLLVPEAHHPLALRILRRIGQFMPTWALATLLAMLMVGTLVFLLMWPLFGFVDALVLGLIAGVLEAIPYIGPMCSAIPALLLSVGVGGSTPIWVLVGYCGVQFLENNLIAPLVMAKGMKLHPVAVMISMLVCVTIFGVLGLIVAAPMVAIVNILHDELYRKRFLPSVTDDEVERMARSVLHEKQISDA